GHQAFLRNFAVFPGWLYRYRLYSLGRFDSGFAKSALHIRQKCPGSQALGAGIHLAHTAGAAEMRIQIGIQIPEISVGGSPHKARRIDRMSKIISRTEIRTGITLAADRCCSL